MIRFFFSLLILIISGSIFASDFATQNRFKLSLSLGNPNDSLSVKSTNGSETNTDFDQIEFRPTLVYFLNNRFATGVYYFQKTILADFDSNGLGGFIRYYFLNDGTLSHSKLENKTITISPTWTPYFELGVKKETLEAGAVSISFSGFEVAAGVDWHWHNDYFVNFAAYRSSQLSGTSRALTSISFLLGFGKAFSL